MSPRHPAPEETVHRPCARGIWCSAQIRDPDTGDWHPAPAGQVLCPADRTALTSQTAELPGCYTRLAAMTSSPVKTGPAVRVPPGSRVLANPEADALMRIIADTTAAWAVRIRNIPQLQLTRHGHPHGSPAQVTADCQVITAHPDPLLALPPAETARTWTWTPGLPMPPDMDEEIGDLDAIAGGDGWIRAFTRLAGEDAALELFDLRRRAIRLLGETPAPPVLLDGIPCRTCEAMPALALAELPVGTPGPDTPEPAYSRCLECRAELTRKEHDDWVAMYGAWARGAGIITCRRCDLGHHRDCCWNSCGCKTAGHPAAA